MDPFPTPRPNYYKVLIKCNTFNHSKFIEDTLNGFVKQQTSFPYVCLILDDASTDGEQQLIKSFLEKECDMSKVQRYDTEPAEVLIAPHRTNQQCTIAIYLLRENHYSIKRSKIPYIQPWRDCCTYEALCEGDDYWIDPLKLQKQVDYLDANPNCTMCCNRTLIYSEKQKKIIGEDYCYNNDRIVDTKDVIYRTGLFISTCSIVYRKIIKDNYPSYCKNCRVGDYPLQIMAAMKGDIYYFNESMSVYRTENSQSWMSKQKWLSVDDSRLRVIHSRINMLEGFANDYPQYKKYFKNKIADEIRRNMPWSMWDYEGLQKYLHSFQEDINNCDFWWKVDFWLLKTRIPILNRYYYKSKRFFSRFQHKRLIYKQ